jgi:hypothetical protein
MKIHEPPMIFKDEAAASAWQQGLAKNQDPYGNACYRFASEWATRMEAALTTGESLESCAKRLSHEADDEGITGFMYGCAMQILAAWWIHGETLRRWHNLDTQIGTEGERANERGTVLNPALLNIGGAE